MKLKIVVDDKAYEVEVDVLEDEQAAPASTHTAAPRFSGASASAANAAGGASKPKDEAVADESKVCRSPINGIVVRVNAQDGQEIHANDPLLVLEAMKMESSITSPVDGRIKSIKVKPGDGVENGQVLVVFE